MYVRMNIVYPIEFYVDMLTIQYNSKHNLKPGQPCACAFSIVEKETVTFLSVTLLRTAQTFTKLPSCSA